MISLKDFKGYDVEEVISNVFVIKNFMLELELNDILNFLKNATEEDWQKTYTENLKNFCLEKFGRSDVENLVAEGKFEITYNWHDKTISLENNEEMNKLMLNVITRLSLIFKNFSNLNLKGLGTLQRQYEGVPLISHWDQHTDPSIEYAAVIYINDEYEDGELFFSNKNFKLKPKAGSLIIFPGTKEFEHGVNAPKGPTRYAIPGFVIRKDFYNENKF